MFSLFSDVPSSGGHGSSVGLPFEGQLAGMMGTTTVSWLGPGQYWQQTTSSTKTSWGHSLQYQRSEGHCHKDAVGGEGKFNSACLTKVHDS